MRRIAVLLAALSVLYAPAAEAHDPSAFGGLFRSRDLGGTWLNADIGLFLNAVLTVAVDPRDPNHLLMGTDVGIFASRNGGRSWTPEAQGLIVGAVFAIAFAPDGRSALAAAPNGAFRLEDGGWSAVRTPEEAVPARAIVFAGKAGRVYLLGRERLFVSEDGGRSFKRGHDTLPETARLSALSLSEGPREILLAVVDGRLMASVDGGREWQPRSVPASGAAVDGAVNAAVADPAVPGRVWAAMRDRIYVSDDLGRDWRTLAGKLPEADTNVRGIVADPTATTLVVSTHRGMYRSQNGGQTWGFMESRLPVHLESGPLVRDPTDARTLYAVYSLLPYPEVWRTAVQGSNLLSRLDFVSIAGGIASVLLVFIAGGLLAYWLVRMRNRTPVSGIGRPAAYRATPFRPRP